MQREPESEQAIAGWRGYLNSHTVKDLMRLGILSDEFKLKFVNGKSDETLARTLYDVLLARTGGAVGLAHWESELGLYGWENVVDRFLASDEYNNRFGDDAVPGDGGDPCVPPPTPADEWRQVEEFYCRVLHRQPESDEAIAGWRGYLNSHTVKDLVRLGILSAEFKTRFVNGKSDETLARILFDVLLAREGGGVGLHAWAKHIGIHGWDSAVNSILASGEYNTRFGDDAVPGGGRAGCVTPTPSDEWRQVEEFYCRVLQRPPESDQAIMKWHDYLQYNTVKDMMRFGSLSAEFKLKFVNGQSDGALAPILFDVLLARTGGAAGLAHWENEVGLYGWDSAVNSILASDEYNNRFGDDAVPGGGRAGCS
jgi:hypothetical protein